MKELNAQSNIPGKTFKTIFLRKGNILEKVYVNDIHVIQSDGNYCRVHVKSKNYLIKKSLVNMANILPSDMFERIHMRNLVAIDKISKINLKTNIAHLDNMEVKIGPRYRADLIKKLNVI